MVAPSQCNSANISTQMFRHREEQKEREEGICKNPRYFAVVNIVVDELVMDTHELECKVFEFCFSRQTPLFHLMA